MTKKNIGPILFVGFLIRFILFVLGKYYIKLPHSDGDALVIEAKSYTYSLSETLDYSRIFSQGHDFLAYIFSFVYSIFGREDFMLGVIMVLLGTILIKYIHDASFLIWKDKKLAIKIAWVAVFFPQFCLHSVLLLREVPINLCLILGIISLIKYLQKSSFIYFIKFLLFTVIGMFLHSAIIFVFIAFLIFYIRVNQKRGFLNKVFVLSLIVGAIYIANSKGIGLGKFGGSLSEGVEEFYIKEARNTTGGSAYPDWMRIGDSITDLWKLPIRFVTFLFAPLIPFLVKSTGHVFGLIDSLFYIFFFSKIYNNRKILSLKKEYKLVLTICLVLCLIFSLGVTNVGTAIRHRAKFAPLLLIIMFEKRNLIKLIKNNNVR